MQSSQFNPIIASEFRRQIEKCATCKMSFAASHLLQSLVLFTLFAQVISYRILFLPPAISPSHRAIIKPWAGSLAAKGHDVWIFGPVEEADYAASKFDTNGVKLRLFSFSSKSHRLHKFPTNYGGSQLNDLLRRSRKLLKFIKMITSGPVFLPESAGFYHSLPICAEFIGHFALEIDAVVNQRWNLVVIDEIFNPCGWEIASRIEAPKAMLSTTLLRPHLSFDYPETLPISLSNIWPDFDYSYRKMFTASMGSVCYLIGFWFNNIDAWSMANEIRNWSDLRRNTSIIFSFFPSMYDFPRPLNEAVIDISGITVETAADRCPTNMTEDFILVSLGNWISRRRKLVAVILQALEIVSRRIRVLMWLPSNGSKFASKHVEIHAELPQKALLACDHCKLFISHGGGSSLQEAIASGVPILGIPLFGDQHANLARLQRFAPLQIWKPNEITVNGLAACIVQLLQNSHSCKLRMQTLKSWFSDRLISPTQKTVHWTLRLAAGNLRFGIRDHNSIRRKIEIVDYSLISISFLGICIMPLVL